MQERDITAVILAGGRGARMGGADKGLQPLAGRPLIAHVIERLQPQAATLIISANRNLEAYRRFGLPVITDRVPGYCGPLAGLHSALYHCETAWLISVPCDTPALPTDYVARMRAASAGQHACVVHDGARPQFGFCLLHRSLLPHLETALANQDYAVYRFLQQVAALEVDFSDQASAFRNINTPEDLQDVQ